MVTLNLPHRSGSLTIAYRDTGDAPSALGSIVSPPPPARDRLIFLSYSHYDGEFTKKIAGNLREAGFSVWFDAKLNPGNPWAEEVQDNLEACVAVVLVLSPSARESKWVQREIQMAVDKGKFVIPIVCRKTRDWYLIAGLYQIDFRDKPEQALQTLIEALSRSVSPRAELLSSTSLRAETTFPMREPGVHSLALQLREVLESYNNNQIRQICGELGIDFAKLGGEDSQGKARELVTYLQQIGRIWDLARLLNRLESDPMVR